MSLLLCDLSCITRSSPVLVCISVAVINQILTKSNLGKERVIWLTGYSQGKTKQEFKAEPGGRNQSRDHEGTKGVFWPPFSGLLHHKHLRLTCTGAALPTVGSPSFIKEQQEDSPQTCSQANLIQPVSQWRLPLPRTF